VSIALSLAILAASVAGLLGVVALVRHFGQRFGWDGEVQRKSVHIAVGLYALALPLLFDSAWPVVTLILVAIVLMLLLRTSHSRTFGLGSAIHSVERKSAGEIWLALAIGFIFLRSGHSYILYALPVAVIALSDAAAALTGTSYGRRRFTTEDGVKSWEGVIAFFAVTLILSMVMLLLLSDVPRLSVVMLALIVAAFGATVEAVSWRGLDNLFVPICIHFFLAVYMHSDPQTLGVLAAIFFAGLVAVALLTRRLGLSAHASRAFTIAIFFFLGVAGLFGTLLPLMVMAMHVVARRRCPCRSGHADLDFVATLCATGLIWHFVGESVGPNAINLYNLALAGMLLGYSMIALRFDWRWGALALALVIGIYFALVEFSPDAARWVASLLWIAAGSLALVLLALLARRGWSERWRAPRLAAVASLVPMAAYLSQTMIP
jgi:dolichol kinase